MTGNQKLVIAGAGCGVVLVALLLCGVGWVVFVRSAAASATAPTAATATSPAATGPLWRVSRNRSDEPLAAGVPFWPFDKQHPIALPAGTHVERIGNMSRSAMPLDLAGWAAPLVRVAEGPHKGEEGYVVEEDLDR